MPGIISPSPDGCLVGIYGHDGLQWIRIAVDANGQIAISADSLPLPTGAATESTLAAISGKLPSALVSDRLKVDGSGVTQPVSAVSLPLPSGASTETTLNALYNTLRLKNLMLYDSLYSYGATVSGSSGSLTVDTAVVPSDKILVVTSCGLLLASGSASFLQLAVSDGTNVRPFLRKLSPVTAEILTCTPFVIVPPGGYIRGSAGSVGSDTSLNIFAVGYYVKYS